MPVRILIVEDHAASQQLMAYLLRKSGYQAVLSDTGERALELVQQEMFDLILCDIHMSGMDGFEVAHRLKASARCSGIPLVAITGLVRPGDRELVLASGFDGFVSKAVSPELVIQEIQTFLPSREGESSHGVSPGLCGAAQ